VGAQPEAAVNDQHMYDLSTPTHPDHLADITAGLRRPARRNQHGPTSDDFIAHTFDEVNHDAWEGEGGAVIDS